MRVFKPDFDGFFLVVFELKTRLFGLRLGYWSLVVACGDGLEFPKRRPSSARLYLA